MPILRRLGLVAAGSLLLATALPVLASSGGEAPPAYWIVPFVLLLGCIALMPFINKHWWEKWYPAVALALGAISASYYFLIAREVTPWLHGMQEYVSFIALLGSLFIVSGGIVIHVGRKATPAANSGLLLIGAVISNIFGTTGASMLLIRPFLRMNKGHLRPFHVVFFIIIVSNVGGALTPIGDPPLFLGYLKGVPFWWVLEHCRWAWLVAVGILIGLFYVVDTIEHGKTERHTPEDPGPAVHIIGIHNILFIALVLWGVFQPGIFEVMHDISTNGFHGASVQEILFSREVLMLGATVGSLLMTSKTIHERNEFNYGPIKEVAILFIGIFSTMAPALHWLNVNAHRMPLNTPGQYYYASGTLSAVLDNAPTYLTFLEVELGHIAPEKVAVAQKELERIRETGELKVDKSLPVDVRGAVEAAIKYHSDDVRKAPLPAQEVQVCFLLGDEDLNLYIVAISLGAVFFGACTYIGNGPNFMVKSIADSAGVHTPSFTGYVAKYTLPILVPIYTVVWFIFLR